MEKYQKIVNGLSNEQTGQLVRNATDLDLSIKFWYDENEGRLFEAEGKTEDIDDFIMLCKDDGLFA